MAIPSSHVKGYVASLTNFKTYKNIIRRSSKNAKRNYYRNVFQIYSSNLKKWNTINESLNNKKVYGYFPQFVLPNDNTIFGTKQIFTAFNDFLSALVIVATVKHGYFVRVSK